MSMVLTGNRHGVERYKVKAAKWYLKSAEQGNANGQWRLGAMYVYGDGVEKDLVKATEWYQKSAEQGDAEAQRLLIAMTGCDELKVN